MRNVTLIVVITINIVFGFAFFYLCSNKEESNSSDWKTLRWEDGEVELDSSGRPIVWRMIGGEVELGAIEYPESVLVK